MGPWTETKKTPKILLSGVFGPYGVDDEFGRKENIMELYHNQVTKAQGPASFRFHHRSFGLYFIADNIDADVTILDFPSRKRFAREVENGDYDMVGISFIMPNMDKAREMARVVREKAPRAEIILGGHGAAIEGVERLIDCDHVVKGEGIRWMREHLGQDPEAPIRHPALPSAEWMSILGVPLTGPASSLLVPGVGCVNGCSFCSTSHFFGKRYTPFIDTGKELFETACKVADERGTDSFFVMDENFLKDRDRALDLLSEMEHHQRFFRFHLFSSAEAITAFGLDNLVRLGVDLVWIGFESQSRQSAFAKNHGIDPKQLVRDLRDRGIAVLASGILCMEHHTSENMQDDIDFLVGLEADFVQFMLLTPIPVTALYEDHKRRGLLRMDLPFQEWHGQKRLSFRHPAFTDDDTERWINRAFRQDYEENSSSMFRMAETAVRGYEHLAAMTERDACLEERLEQSRDKARSWSLILPSVAKNAVNPLERNRANKLYERVGRLFGRRLWERVAGQATIVLGALWKIRLKLIGDGMQPKTIVTRYSAAAAAGRLSECRTAGSKEREARLEFPPAAAAMTAHPIAQIQGAGCKIQVPSAHP
ncbi:MAG: cobalamin-dependent protein [Acidobacteriota bacterium]|nr:cobalamin-dependent protein [Acidobacteriota bacterium]